MNKDVKMEEIKYKDITINRNSSLRELNKLDKIYEQDIKSIEDDFWDEYGMLQKKVSIINSYIFPSNSDEESLRLEVGYEGLQEVFEDALDIFKKVEHKLNCLRELHNIIEETFILVEGNRQYWGHILSKIYSKENLIEDAKLNDISSSLSKKEKKLSDILFYPFK